ncbi:ribosomal protein S10p/S20e [Coccidioides immitis RS]|uniref:Small ribosomal subunit protein uS10m n=4 Tax=Coccidioides immitis TaxID=5501 RepID=A0A0D8JRK3_COCIM|nr:ribosomal protein S10p/S20e [Coccidioides immitis RS]KMP10158.1 30S ribosomal protein S10 [Coccidioides immitis RMSCC 2394]KMU80774.1 30S ribosomal protein S10 [Coccidioides immitis RMSCC 3703]KMU86671.1 30S ribosomal protein S10 [Coccidioides immitis H538.4]TPX24794.1 mitochondrial 37S ribosomal protein rsm10 [Coccidioides immitis]KJF59985.1 ribosomal protein S10p/S20e [Coccidioides immitis RS]
MFSFSYFRSALRCSKRLKLSSPARPLTTTSLRLEEDRPSNVTEMDASELTPQQLSYAEAPDEDPEAKEWMDRLESINSKFRLPRSVQAVYLKPLKRKAEYGLPVCDLQLRSYSARHVEFFADFALRAAYYLNLPASGPVPLPRLIERWTLYRSPFIHRKTPENFERITMRRLIQIKDGNSESVQAWLAFLRKHAFHGVGMKANVWEHASLGVGKSMDQAGDEVLKALEAELGQFGTKKNAKSPESVADIIEREKFTRNHAPLSEVRKG